jgi:hypothetical protein
VKNLAVDDNLGAGKFGTPRKPVVNYFVEFGSGSIGQIERFSYLVGLTEVSFVSQGEKLTEIYIPPRLEVNP